LAWVVEGWSAAIDLASTNRPEAEKIRRALLELYGERDWASEALREAKATDWSDAAQE
jgi:hypothetical protein